MLIARWGGLLRWFCRSPPQRAIIGLRIIILLRLATNIEFMGQQWCRTLFYLTRLKASAVTISNAIDGIQVTIAGFRLNTWPEFAIISLARK